jgi:hypothetical protein
MIFRQPDVCEAALMAELHVQCWREAYADILPQAVVWTCHGLIPRP